MSIIGQLTLPENTCGLKLHRIQGEKLISCELVMFTGGEPAVNTVLRRAAISGRVEIDGKIENHFADIYVDDHTWVETVALDAKSYSALKNHWMRCKVDQ